MASIRSAGLVRDDEGIIFGDNDRVSIDFMWAIIVKILSLHPATTN